MIEEGEFPVANKTADLVIDERNAFIMTSMLRDVVQRGTARRARSLGRQDLAGKTGTTNNTIDAWFAGYSPHEVAISWMGYDTPHSLGRVEAGGRAALPIWIKYMATALKGKPDNQYEVPAGLMSLRINPTTGTLVDENEAGISEYFYNENPPPLLELELPPLMDLFESDFPMGDLQNNPLQPGTPLITNNPLPEVTQNPATSNNTISTTKPKEPTPDTKPSSDHTTSTGRARSVLNPSGF